MDQTLQNAKQSNLRLLAAKPALAAVLVTLLSGCSQTLVREATTATHADSPTMAADAAPPAQEPENNVVERPFPEQTLYNLLVGELASLNNDLPLGVEKYLQEARLTRDSGVASHATRLAIFSRNAEAALDAANLWYDIEPDSQKAATIYADMLIKADQPLAALDVLEAQLKYQREPNFGILTQSNKLQPGSTTLVELIARLEALLEQQDINIQAKNAATNVELIFTYALLLQQNEQHSEALASLGRIKHNDSNPTQTALLKAQLLEKLEGDESAARGLAQSIKRIPENRALKIYYARLLTRYDLPAAEVEFSKLLADTPNDTDIIFSHAIVAFENQNFDAARKSFEQLVSRSTRVLVSHYHLGQIDQAQARFAAAVARYRQINRGKYFMAATQKLVELLATHGQMSEARAHLASLRASVPLQAPNFWALEADLLKRNGRADEANDILDEAIERFPEQLLLRLERAFIYEQFNDIEGLEKDLRFVLDRDPDNVTALNALGYTLADRTSRYREALGLIEKAMALRPGDAAIIDSLGWVQYRLGDIKAATVNLETAFSKFADDEVAAHLVEVYWVSGKKNKARALIKKQKKSNEDTTKVDETVQRLGINY